MMDLRKVFCPNIVMYLLCVPYLDHHDGGEKVLLSKHGDLLRALKQKHGYVLGVPCHGHCHESKEVLLPKHGYELS